MSITYASTTEAETQGNVRYRAWQTGCMDIPMSSELGSARSGYVKTSSWGPIDTFVITGEPNAERTTEYGFVPPDIVIPQGSQVVRWSVTFGFMVAKVVRSGVGWQVLVLPTVEIVSM